MRDARVVHRTMAPGEDEVDPELETIEEIVPARAVLTELARGFLLVHESDPAHALRFATGFLRERSGQEASLERVEPVQKLSLARLSLGRGNRGAIEPGRGPSSPP
jgi:hypothetical protein